MGTADHELACRVNVKDQVVVDQIGRKHAREQVLDHIGLDLLERDLIGVLRRDDDGVDALDGFAVVGVLDRDLALGVGAQVRHRLAAFSDGGQLLDEPVREVQAERHQFVGFARGVAEHHALITCALLLVQPVALVDALRDVGALLVNRRDYAAALGVES